MFENKKYKWPVESPYDVPTAQTSWSTSNPLSAKSFNRLLDKSSAKRQSSLRGNTHTHTHVCVCVCVCVCPSKIYKTFVTLYNLKITCWIITNHYCVFCVRGRECNVTENLISWSYHLDNSSGNTEITFHFERHVSSVPLWLCKTFSQLIISRLLRTTRKVQIMVFWRMWTVPMGYQLTNGPLLSRKLRGRKLWHKT